METLDQKAFCEFLINNGANEDCLKFTRTKFEGGKCYESLRSNFPHITEVIMGKLINVYKKTSKMNRRLGKYVGEQIDIFENILLEPHKYVDSFYARATKRQS